LLESGKFGVASDELYCYESKIHLSVVGYGTRADKKTGDIEGVLGISVKEFERSFYSYAMK
jgi:hypothetical protein